MSLRQSSPFRALLPALAALSLGACTTVNLPPADQAAANVAATPGQIPVVDASIRHDGVVPATGAAAATGAVATPVADSTVQGQPLTGLHLQAGTFATHAAANTAADRIRSKVPGLASKVVVAPRGERFRVLVGPFASDAERQAAAGTIRTQTGSDVVNAAP